MGRKKPFVDKKTAATYTLVFKSGQDGDQMDRVFVRTDDGPACVPGFGDEDDERRSRFAGDADSSNGSFAGYWAGSRSQEPPLSAEQRQDLVDAGVPDDGYNYLRHLRSISEQGIVPAAGFTLDRLRPDVKVYAASAESGAAKAVSGREFQDLEDDKDFEAQSDGEIEDDFVVIANEGGDGARDSDSISKRRLRRVCGMKRLRMAIGPAAIWIFSLKSWFFMSTKIVIQMRMVSFQTLR